MITRAHVRATLRALIVCAALACALGLALDVREAMQARRGAWSALADALQDHPTPDETAARAYWRSVKGVRP